MSVYFPIEILRVNNGQISYYTKLSLGTAVGHVIPKVIVIETFNYAEQNGYREIFVRRLWGKGAWEEFTWPTIFLVT